VRVDRHDGLSSTDQGGGKRRPDTVIRWNFHPYGALCADGVIAVEGKYRHTELAIGTIGSEHYQSRIESDTMSLRGCNQPTSTHPAPERLLSLP